MICKYIHMDRFNKKDWALSIKIEGKGKQELSDVLDELEDLRDLVVK